MLRVSGLKKSYGSEVVLRGVSLTHPAGETMAILGRSGSGKTTLLKAIAGLVECDAGAIELDGVRVNGLVPEKRGCVYLYQEPLLFPHLDVFENVAFGLRVRRVGDVGARVEAMLEGLGLTAQMRKRTDALSGGQRQRVAFGRALVVEPRLLLLDEPFGALDVETRASMQDLFRGLARTHGTTALFVTHDLKEALTVGDRLGTLRDGTLTTYVDRAAFLADERAGAQDEIRFWTNLK